MQPITLHHYLQLYSKEDIGNTNAPKKTVISESFDEVVFVDPIDPIYEMIMAHPSELPLAKTCHSTFCNYIIAI